MNTGDIVAIVLTLIIIGCATAYIIKAKKSGRKCIGCPDGASCNGNCASCSLTAKETLEQSDSEEDVENEEV